jgi:hypothetical protein
MFVLVLNNPRKTHFRKLPQGLFYFIQNILDHLKHTFLYLKNKIWNSKKKLFLYQILKFYVCIIIVICNINMNFFIYLYASFNCLFNLKYKFSIFLLQIGQYLQWNLNIIQWILVYVYRYSHKIQNLKENF